jgi:opacity protein-like surface antigen
MKTMKTKRNSSKIFGCAAMSLMLASLAQGGTNYSYSAKEPVPLPAFEEVLRVSMFGTYRQSFGGDVNNRDDFGAGISMYLPIGESRFGVEASYAWRNGNLSDVNEFGIAGRFNFLEMGDLTVYAIAGAAYQFTGNSFDAWGYDAGVGVDLALTERLTLFADYRYRWADRNRIGDTGGVRAGLGYSF